MNVKIAICDEDKNIDVEYKCIIDKWLENNNINCTVDCYQTGHDFLANANIYDIVFLDYKLPDINGFDVATEIRKTNKCIFIVFITAFADYVFKSFRINTFRYLVKPVSNNDIIEAVQSFVNIYMHDIKIEVPTANAVYYIDADDILYIEADKKKTIVRTNESIISSTKSISKFESEIINPHFFRTHKSYIVNMKYIYKKDKSIILLNNGEKIIVSAKNTGIFNDHYNVFLKKNFSNIEKTALENKNRTQ